MEVQVNIGASNTQINRPTSENRSLNRESRLVECSATSIGNLDKREQAILGLQIVKVNTLDVDTRSKIEIKENKVNLKKNEIIVEKTSLASLSVDCPN